MSIEQKINQQLNKYPALKRKAKRIYQRTMYTFSEKKSYEGVGEKTLAAVMTWRDSHWSFEHIYRTQHGSKKAGRERGEKASDVVTQ